MKKVLCLVLSLLLILGACSCGNMERKDPDVNPDLVEKTEEKGSNDTQDTNDIIDFNVLLSNNIKGQWKLNVSNNEILVDVDSNGSMQREGKSVGKISFPEKNITISGIDFGQKPIYMGMSEFGVVAENTRNHSNPAIQTDKYSVNEIAYYLGVKSNLSKPDNPKSKDDFIACYMYNALRGEYITEYILDDVTKDMFFETDCWRDWMKDLSLALPELFGSYCNIMFWGYYDGKGCNNTHFKAVPDFELLNQQQIYNRQIAAIDKALEIDKQLRANNQIKDSMTEMEKAKVFAEYLKSQGLIARGGGNGADNMLFDTAFSGLIQNVAACGGRAAALNLLLRTEGIACTAIGCTVNEDGGGHFINRMVLDGNDYYYDWFNEPWFPKIMTKTEAEKVVTFYSGQIEFTGSLIEAWKAE